MAELFNPVNLASPGPIGSGTPSSITLTTAMVGGLSGLMVDVTSVSNIGGKALRVFNAAQTAAIGLHGNIGLVSFGFSPVSIVVNDGVNKALTAYGSTGVFVGDSPSDPGTGNLQIGGALLAKSPNGTLYKLSPPNGGGTATWVAA